MAIDKHQHCFCHFRRLCFWSLSRAQKRGKTIPCSLVRRANRENRGRRSSDGVLERTTNRQVANMIKEHNRSARPTTDAWKKKWSSKDKRLIVWGHHWFNMDWMRCKEERWEESELLLDFTRQPTQSVAASEEEEKDQGAASVKRYVYYFQIPCRWCLVPSGLNSGKLLLRKRAWERNHTWAQYDNDVRGLYDLWLVDEDKLDPQKSCWNWTYCHDLKS